MNPSYKLFQSQAQENPQLFTLLRLAVGCEHVSALTMNSYESASTFLTAQTNNIRIYNLSEVDAEIKNTLESYAKEIGVKIKIEPNKGEIETTDLLYVNTPAEGNYRAMELGKYAEKVRKYIVLPNTVQNAHKPSDAIKLSDEIKPIGLVFGINHFLQSHDNWFILEHDDFGAGVTILVNKDNVKC